MKKKDLEELRRHERAMKRREQLLESQKRHALEAHRNLVLQARLCATGVDFVKLSVSMVWSTF